MFNGLCGRGLRSIFALWVVIGLNMFLFCGCEESPESISRKEAAGNLDEAARRVLGSHQQVALTEGEIEKIRSSGSNQALINSVVNRLMESEQEYEPFNSRIGELSATLQQLITRLDSQQYQPEDGEALREITKQIHELNTNALSSHAIDYRRIIDRNHGKISSAIAVLQGSSEHFGTQLLLGAVHLTGARDLRDHSREVLLEIQSELILLGRLSGKISAETAFAKGLPSFFPYQATLGALSDRLDGGDDVGDSLQDQLNDAIKRVGQFLLQKEQTEVSLDAHRHRESQIHKEILELMEKAERAQGDEKYEIIAKAHQLRSDRSGGNSQDGIYYEAQIELLENKLAVIMRRLSYEQLREKLLTEAVDEIKQSMVEFEKSPFHADIRQGLQESQEISGELLVELKSHLSSLGTAVTQYHSLRAEAANGYSQSHSAYLRAKRLARGDSKTTQYASQMADRIQNELANSALDSDVTKNIVKNPAGLWQEDVLFYEGIADVLQMLVQIEGLRDNAVEVRQDILNMAGEAKKSINGLLGESG